MRTAMPAGPFAALSCLGLLLLAAPAARAQAPLAAEGCHGCHGPGGAGMGSVPGIAGRDAEELRTMLAQFRADARPATIMGRIVRGYTEAELTAIAAHFAQAPR